MFDAADPSPAAPPNIQPAEPRRYRWLQVGSLLLIASGVAIAAGVVQTTPGILSGDGSLAENASRAVSALTWLVVAGLALLVGLLAHAARSIVVRQTLPESQYRGPSIIVLLVLAIIAANLAVLSAASEVAALLEGGELTPVGTLVVLTVTQLGLLGTSALFVAAPRALVGLRLLPPRGLWRSAGLGLVLALPAWIGAQLVGVSVIRLLELVGMRPETGVAEEVALSRADPLVLIVALVVVAPVAEEVFFRGVVYNAWLREYGPRSALLGSAILFGLIHGSIFLFAPIVALGVVLALVYRATGSLPAAIALHAGFNGITVALGLLVRFEILDLPIT